MSELIERIPGQESMLGKLRGVVNTTAQIKARQRLTGRAGQLGYIAQTDLDWDYTATLPVPTPPAYNTALFRVTFTGDGSQRFPIVIPLTDIRINGVDESNRLVQVPSSGLYTYTDGLCDVLGSDTVDQPEPDLLGDEFQLAWEFSFQYQGSVTIRIKGRGQASCPGSWTATRVS